MNNEQYDIIEQYLNGELSSEALAAFEEQLKNDKELAAELLLYKNIQDVMKRAQQNEAEEKALTATLKNLSHEHFAKPVVRTATLRRMWPYAAAAAVVIIFFVGRSFFNTTATNGQLYAEYAVPEKISAAQRGGNNDSLLIAAAGLYNKKLYSTALPMLNIIVQQNITQPELVLALGICQIQTGDAATAIQTFDRLIAGESIYKYEGSFWKALVLLKQDKKADAKTVLQQIPAGASSYEKAGKLMKEM